NCLGIQTESSPIDRSVVGAYYLGYGRNAWHSTWVNIYIPQSISFDLGELKALAEKLRTQGSVFKIQAIPMLLLRYPKETFGIVPINEAGKYEYDLLIETMQKDEMQNFWKYLPAHSKNWLLSFRLEPKVLVNLKPFSPILFRGHSGGTQHSLAWATKRPAPDYKQFLSFADRLNSLFETADGS
ncbi:MAG TPA: hypothetical protein VHE09_02315, partial [Rhizomicrobium sp.]|nr:hypothetical protein [Rhizomicrobium sp.]